MDDQTTPAEQPVSDEHGTPYARAYDDKGNVRPADGRWLGDANGDVPAADLAQMREDELEDAKIRRQREFEKLEEETQARLDAAGYVNPTTPEARARDAAGLGAAMRQAPAPTPEVSTPANGAQSRWAEAEYSDMQAAAKDIDGIPGNLPKEELRAALEQYDRDNPPAA
jgi:hypothetical protein